MLREVSDLSFVPYVTERNGYKMDKFTAVIMAAGMGTRMKSEKPKVIHEICRKPICAYAIDAAREAGAGQIIMIVGHCREAVIEKLGDVCEYAYQAEQKGTGHACMQAADMINEKYCVILSGDAPLLRAESIKKAVEFHVSEKNAVTVLTACADDPTGYGRIIRDADGSVVKITEHKDATDEERKIREINSGMYVFNSADLKEALGKIKPDNSQGEYYLTDTIEIIKSEGKKAGGFVLLDIDEIRGINDRVQLCEAEKIMQKRINESFMRGGVTIHSPETVLISPDCEIGSDTEIFSDTVIERGSKIGSGVTITSASRISNAVIGSGVSVQSSVILDSTVGENTTVGPFAYIRPNCVIGKKARIGDFVELKNANIGDGTKVSHLTYVGDSDVGEGCNFGCGTVTVNYDGKKKYRTTIGNNVFIGCNSNLVAPVTLKDGAYTAAGSTITDEVPENNLAIARARQVNKEIWKDRRK